jgi:hypothetical protein
VTTEDNKLNLPLPFVMNPTPVKLGAVLKESDSPLLANWRN